MLQRFQEWMKERTVHHLLGVDIGSSNIKILEIDHTVSPNIIQNMMVLPLSDRVMNKEGIKNPETIGSLLKDALKNQNINTKNAAIAISRSTVVTKDIQIGKRLTPTEIESRVWTEANRHFPELVGDIYLDFLITGTAAQDPTQLNVMLVACRKDQIKPYLEILRYAGLTPKIVNVSSFALEKALINMTASDPQPETIGLINLDLASSNFIVMHANALHYALDQTYDGQKLVNQIKEYLLAAKTSETQGTLNDEAYLTILKDNLISHLRHAMHFFFSSRPNTVIKRLFLSGDCSDIPHLAVFIQQEFGIETVLANPFNDMLIADKIDRNQAKKTASMFMLSSGLALSKYTY